MATIRPQNLSTESYTSTIRPNSNPNGDISRTVRPNGIGSTMRPDKSKATIRPGALSGIDSALTLRPTSDKTTKPQKASEVTTSLNEKVDTNMYQPRTSYTINGLEYTVIKALSLTSGEAQVFLVEDPNGKKSVLKLYYKGAIPNASILNKVASVNNASILFWEDSHGNFEDRYFELMKYYDGDNLENIDVRKNEAIITQYIGKMAAAIDLCHHLGFIHRDIKPSNFVFETKKRENILLGDFGIAVECDANGRSVADMARTKIYAAPEVYLNTGDGKANFSIKSDFYSLGIVILFLWMGKDEFTHFEKENELQLATMKSYGDLPIPNNMPIRLYSLVRALIEPKPGDRAGFKEVEEWLKGGDPFGVSANDNLSHKTKFNVVFNGEKGLIATTPKELARIMFANQQLAISYLYKGKVTQWLEDNGRPELAVEMDRIKEDLYPRNTTAGLEAACYQLNPAMPYVDICGNNCTTSSEIAKSILSNFNKYQKEITENSNNRLLIYLQAHGLEQLVIDFRKEFSNNQRLGLLYLAYRLDAKQPWYMTDGDNHEVSLNSCDEIINWASKNYASDQSLSDIVSNAFLVWVNARNAIAAAAIHPLMNHQGDLTYSDGILYRLNPKVGLYFILDENSPNYVLSIQQIGTLLNKSILNVVNETDSNGMCKSILAEFFGIQKGEKTSIYHFLKSKGSAYDQYIDWIKYSLDVDAVDNAKKAGPYNHLIGLFQLVRVMNGDVFYTFKSGKTISNPLELAKVSEDDLQDAKNNQYRPLEAWISVFYQEDPTLDKKSKYSYEKKASEYINYLSSHGFDSPEIQRYNDSKLIVESKAKKLRDTLSTIKRSRLLVSVISLLPLGIAALLLAFLWRPDFGSLEFMTVFKPVAIILTICFCFMDGFAGRVIGEIVWGCIIGAIVSYLLVWLSGIAAALTPYIATALVVALGFYFYNKCIGSNLKEQENDELLNPGFEHIELEPLYEAYHPSANGFDSSIGDRTTAYQKELSQIKKTMWTKAVPVGVITVIGILYFIFNPSISNSLDDDGQSTTTIEQVMPNFNNGLYGIWVGKLNNKNVQVEFDPPTNPQEFKFTMSDIGDASGKFVISGDFNQVSNELRIKKCRISEKSGIAVNVKSSGTLKLNNDRITGEVDVQIPQSDIESISLPIDVSYVPE